VKVIRLPQVKKKVGLGHTSIYEGQKAGTFPKSIELGPRSRGWVGKRSTNGLSGESPSATARRDPLFTNHFNSGSRAKKRPADVRSVAGQRN
jgi:prophage regulatory protein